MDEQGLELKVGLLALVALAVAVGLIVALSGITGGHRITVYADFGYAGGLPAGAAVRIAGVKVGRIREVQFLPELHDAAGRPTPVRIVADIDAHDATALRSDATATVGSQGALGEADLEILTGTAATPLPPGAIIPGLDPPRLDVVLARLFSFLNEATMDQAVQHFLVEVSHLAQVVGHVLDANQTDVAHLLKSMANLLGNADGMMADAKSALRSASTLLGSEDVRQMISDLAETAHAAKTDLPGLLSDTRSMVADLKVKTGKLTPEDVARIQEMIVRYDALGAQLQGISGRADKVLAAIQSGDGTVAQMIRDPKVYEDLRSFLADIKAHPWRLVWKQ